MERELFLRIEKFMSACMKDCVHDREHVYRVLGNAMEIAACHEMHIDYDVLITACLLHDIARCDENNDPRVDHAILGATMARDFLSELGLDENFCENVAGCVRAHRFRGDNPPRTNEEIILFDADTLDSYGAIGVARAMLYLGMHNEPIYRVDSQGHALSGKHDCLGSFFSEYHGKIGHIEDRLFTARARRMARERRAAVKGFSDSLWREIESVYPARKALLSLIKQA